MQIIRDINDGGILMIPAFHHYGISRCNIAGCKEKPTSICIHEQANFGLCEKHYQKGKEAGTMTLKLKFT